MQRSPRRFARLFSLGILLLFVGSATAQEKNHLDAASPSGQFRVTVTWRQHSPTPEGHLTAADYNYTCVNTQAGRTLWTHRYKDDWDHVPDELYVSDHGWTIICSRGSVVIPIDPTGNDHGQIDLLQQFSGSDRKRYVQDVMDAPPQWAGESLWYFLDAEGRPCFVVRPWWGHHVIVDLAAGKSVPPSRAVEAAIDKQERAEVMTRLNQGADSFKTWENECCPSAAVPVCTAAYLAGVLHVSEAVPLLRRLEVSTYSQRSGGGAFLPEAIKPHDGKIEPSSASDFTLRQFVQLSLRRLGQKPSRLPGIGLERKFVDYKRDKFFVPATPGVPRVKNVDRIGKGSSAEQVVALIGGPDVSNGSRWEYDLDTVPARTLVITWQDYQIESVKFERPAVWQQPGKREMEVCY